MLLMILSLLDDLVRLVVSLDAPAGNVGPLRDGKIGVVEHHAAFDGFKLAKRVHNLVRHVAEFKVRANVVRIPGSLATTQFLSSDAGV